MKFDLFHLPPNDPIPNAPPFHKRVRLEERCLGSVNNMFLIVCDFRYEFITMVFTI